MFRLFIYGMPQRFRGFAKDRRGQTALTFSLAAVPMLVVVGSAIDYSRSVATRSNLQQATDSTVLAMTHSYLKTSSTSTSMMAPTQAYLSGAMGTAAPGAATDNVTATNGRAGTLGAATVTNITLSSGNTKMCITTSEIIPTYIMSLFSQKYVAVGADACSNLPNTFEIAMALDNSYSMSQAVDGTSKMDSLKSAAKSLVDILIPDSGSSSVAMSLVPFASLVNVGPSTSAAFLDTQGKSSIHWQNFNIPSVATYRPASKFDLFTSLGATWAGCVEERPGAYTTTDTPASSATPDTMFVPYFAPDDPGDFNNVTLQNGMTGVLDKNNKFFINSYLKDNNGDSAGGTCSDAGNSNYKTLDAATGNIYPGSGLTMACKYSGASPKYAAQVSGMTTSPNFMCTAKALTSLTTDKTVLKNAIDAMSPAGSTNLSAGFMWAWRAISPVFRFKTIASPTITGPQNPRAYDTTANATNTKIIILMTDGFNSWSSLRYDNGSPTSPFMSTYEAFGYMPNQRLSTYNTTCGGAKGSGYVTTYSTWRCQMDNVLRDACSNAKASTTKVVVYTVGFTISSDPIDQQGIDLLKGCASVSTNYYQASDGAGIIDAFQKIAASIQKLRLSS